MANFSTSVGASSDDAHQSGASMDLTGTTWALTAEDRWGGLRFTGVTIGQGDTIDAASVSLEVISASFDDADFDIYGEDVDDAATFTTTNNDISGRTLTTAKVTWTATAMGTGIKASPDIKTVIQEIVDRAGWASGNDIVIIFDCLTNANARFASWDHATQAAPSISIDYTAGGATFEQSVAGTLSFVGSATKQTGKMPAGALSFGGALIKRTDKILAGALTFAGELTKQTNKVLSGAVSFAGDLAAQLVTAGKGLPIIAAAKRFIHTRF